MRKKTRKMETTDIRKKPDSAPENKAVSTTANPSSTKPKATGASKQGSSSSHRTKEPLSMKDLENEIERLKKEAKTAKEEVVRLRDSRDSLWNQLDEQQEIIDNSKQDIKDLKVAISDKENLLEEARKKIADKDKEIEDLLKENGKEIMEEARSFSPEDEDLSSTENKWEEKFQLENSKVMTIIVEIILCASFLFSLYSIFINLRNRFSKSSAEMNKTKSKL